MMVGGLEDIKNPKQFCLSRRRISSTRRKEKRQALNYPLLGGKMLAETRGLN